MTGHKAKQISDEEDQIFRLLRQLDMAPDAAQRATATALGISLGHLNAQLKAAAGGAYRDQRTRRSRPTS